MSRCHREQTLLEHARFDELIRRCVDDVPVVGDLDGEFAGQGEFDEITGIEFVGVGEAAHGLARESRHNGVARPQAEQVIALVADQG